MITLNPVTDVALGHRAFHVAAADSGHVVALSPEGLGSVLAPDYITCTPFRLSVRPTDVAISPSGSLFAVAGDNALVFVSTSTLKEVHRIAGVFVASHFTSDRNLWSAVKMSDSSIALEICDVQTSKVMNRKDLADPFGDSAFTFFPHPDNQQVAVWVAAGQDGQCIFWVRREGSKIVVDRFSDLAYTTQPVFSPSGDRLLLVYEGTELRHYVFPQGPLLATMQWPLNDGEDGIDYAVSFLDSDHAMVQSSRGRLYLIRLPDMSIVDEVCIVGHEPRPTAQLYPTLRDESLCSDISWCLRLPTGQFLSIHRELPSRSHVDWRDRLITWTISVP